jgi:myo-inositol-1(or 4)-monophosphatase
MSKSSGSSARWSFVPDEAAAEETAPDRFDEASLIVIAGEVAQIASDSVRTKLGSARQIGTKSTPTDTVTSADIETESLIRDALRQATPGASIVGEEGTDVDGTSDLGWIIDPIDGTVNFLYGLPVVAISIAATREDRVVAGAVADVLRGEIFTAGRGLGARLNGDTIRTSSTRDIEDSLIATGFSYSAKRRREEAEAVSRILPAARDIRCFGSAALNLAWVACGRVDGYWESDTNRWDVAAGALVAEEAGAVVELGSTGTGSVLAAPHALIGPLRRLVSG